MTLSSVSADQRVTQVLQELRQAVETFSPVVFASSMGAEDMVLTDLIFKHKLDIEIFTIDTGRLPQETYDLIAVATAHYGKTLTIFVPQAMSVEAMTKRYGINGFFDSIDARKACCHARKVEPLKRALNGKRAWVTGLRSGQARTRDAVTNSEFDEGNGLQKINPLSHWTEADVWEYLHANSVPYNALHDKGYPSIGCAPCTRAIQPGEDIRAGRWWWENPETKECGLHMVDGRLQRIKALEDE
jgi:phosphoadenosine phosphosulfate reductase